MRLLSSSFFFSAGSAMESAKLALDSFLAVRLCTSLLIRSVGLVAVTAVKALFFARAVSEGTLRFLAWVQAPVSGAERRSPAQRTYFGAGQKLEKENEKEGGENARSIQPMW